MIFEAKKILEVLAEFESDSWNEHAKACLNISDRDERDRKTTITATKISVVREIRDRLRLPEIKA